VSNYKVGAAAFKKSHKLEGMLHTLNYA